MNRGALVGVAARMPSSHGVRPCCWPIALVPATIEACLDHGLAGTSAEPVTRSTATLLSYEPGESSEPRGATNPINGNFSLNTSPAGNGTRSVAEAVPGHPTLGSNFFGSGRGNSGYGYGNSGYGYGNSGRLRQLWLWNPGATVTDMAVGDMAAVVRQWQFRLRVGLSAGRRLGLGADPGDSWLLKPRQPKSHRLLIHCPEDRMAQLRRPAFRPNRVLQAQAGRRPPHPVVGAKRTAALDADLHAIELPLRERALTRAVQFGGALDRPGASNDLIA